MLTQKDIEFIKNTRKEIVNNRLKPLLLFIEGAQKEDEITGVITSSTEELNVDAVVTDITSKAVADRYINEQAPVIVGDIWFSVSIDQLKDIDVDAIKAVIHNGRKYAVTASDPKGLGEYNRYEFLGKREI